MSDPVLVVDSLAVPFKFWDEQIQDGIRLGRGLFRHYKTLTKNERSQAFEIAKKLAVKGNEVVITSNFHQYRIWIKLRNL
jgi:hypothetical protein